MYLTPKTNIDLLLENAGFLDLACEETFKYYESIGEPTDGITLKDVYAYVMSKPYPYIPNAAKEDL